MGISFRAKDVTVTDVVLGIAFGPVDKVPLEEVAGVSLASVNVLTTPIKACVHCSPRGVDLLTKFAGTVRQPPREPVDKPYCGTAETGNNWGLCQRRLSP